MTVNHINKASSRLSLQARKLIVQASLHEDLDKAEKEAERLRKELSEAETEVERLKKEIKVAEDEESEEGEKEASARLSYNRIYARQNSKVL